jgi:two-component system sensor kinase FixL
MLGPNCSGQSNWRKLSAWTTRGSIVGLTNPLKDLGFNSLFEASAEALVLADSDGIMQVSNPVAQQLFGYADRELRGQSVEMLMPTRLREYHSQYMRQYLSRSEKRPMGRGRDLLALSRDGRELQVNIGLSPLLHQGRTYVLISFFDATHTREAQRLLLESEERLRLAEDAAGLGVFDRDLGSNTLHWDDRALAILGVTDKDGITYQRFLELIHPDDRSLRQAVLERAFDPAGNGEYRSDFRILRPGEHEARWIASSGRVIFEGGQPARIVGVIQDITEQKQSELKLREQRGAMETLLKRQVAAQTASAIAHELNQPLAAISAYSEVALHELDRIEAPDKLARAISCCFEQAQRAGSKLHELMEFLHQGDLVPEPMDLAEVVSEAAAVVQNDVLGLYRELLEFPPERMALVQANRLQIQKVLINLMRNACEAMHDHGLDDGEVLVRIQPMADRHLALVTVQDTGPGLTVDQARRIFDPFFTTKSRGVGMGLAISRALVEANGGELWADANPGAGGIFHFTLPFSS